MPIILFSCNFNCCLQKPPFYMFQNLTKIGLKKCLNSFVDVNTTIRLRLFMRIYRWRASLFVRLERSSATSGERVAHTPGSIPDAEVEQVWVCQAKREVSEIPGRLWKIFSDKVKGGSYCQNSRTREHKISTFISRSMRVLQILCAIVQRNMFASDRAHQTSTTEKFHTEWWTETSI